MLTSHRTDSLNLIAHRSFDLQSEFHGPVMLRNIPDFRDRIANHATFSCRQPGHVVSMYFMAIPVTRRHPLDVPSSDDVRKRCIKS
ncbi:hypothetical protein PSAC2689_170129 [Paraburkholderia sacchari]